MDLTAGLKNEIVRPTLTLLVPGATALGPYIVQARRLAPGLRDYLEQHRTVGAATALLAVLAAGLVLESLGSWLEAGIVDVKLRKKYPKLLDDWYDYLRLSFDKEPVGQRYLRTVTLHLKFELAMVPALTLCAIGVNWLNSDVSVFNRPQIWGITIGLLMLAAYFAFETFSSARVLAKIRFALLTSPGTPLPAELAGVD